MTAPELPRPDAARASTGRAVDPAWTVCGDCASPTVCRAYRECAAEGRNPNARIASQADGAPFVLIGACDECVTPLTCNAAFRCAARGLGLAGVLLAALAALAHPGRATWL